MQRILTLASYFTRTLFTSLTGPLYLILTLAYWLVFFNPMQRTPDVAYFTLVIGAFGAGMAFLVTLSIAARANEAAHWPWIVRLPSRVEYVTAVLLSAIVATALLQLLLAALALYNGPSLAAVQVAEIPPVWLPLIMLAAVLGLHASELVTSGWSRVYVFGILAILLFGRGINNQALSAFANSLNQLAFSQGWLTVSDAFNNWSIALSESNTNVLSRLFGFVFWPFSAVAEATINGFFSATEALAPAILLLYATILFMLAADLFASKDLEFTE